MIDNPDYRRYQPELFSSVPGPPGGKPLQVIIVYSKYPDTSGNPFKN
jgi:hypothetical protein